MIDIHSFQSAFKTHFGYSFLKTFSLSNEWIEYGSQLIKNFTLNATQQSLIQKTSCIALHFFVLKKTNDLAHYLEKRLSQLPKKLNHESRIFNEILINVVVVGGLFFLYQHVLSTLLNEPLNKNTLTAATAIVILVRWFFFSTPIETETSLKNEKASFHHPRSNLRPYSIQNTFIHDFCKEISSTLQQTFKYVKFSEKERAAQEKFLKEMSNGSAILQGDRDFCTTVCISIQAAFEKYLLTSLSFGFKYNLKAKAIFLSELPCEPLRLCLKQIKVDGDYEAKKWRKEIRTETLRDLQEVGLDVFICYHAADYDTLLFGEDDAKLEHQTYQKEKNERAITDIPLSSPIPKELRGALYFLENSDGEHYTFMTQDIQTSADANQTPQTSWTVLFGPSNDGEIKARTDQILRFIKGDYPDFLAD